MSVADSVRAAAEAAVKESERKALEAAGMVYDSNSGMYYDYNSGYYYDSVRRVILNKGNSHLFYGSACHKESV